MNIYLLGEMELRAGDEGKRAFDKTFRKTKDANQAAKAKTKAIVEAVNGFEFHDFTEEDENEFNETKKFLQDSLKEELRGRG